MNFLKRHALCSPRVPAAANLLLASAIFLAFTIAGCSGGGGTGAALSGSTAVTVVTSSTANDALTEFTLYITGITLTDKSGNSFTVLDTPRYVEFMHQNGLIEPLVTARIPQGVYTSATVSAKYGTVVCATLGPSGGLQTYGALNVTASDVTVDLQAPITITGMGMGLTLNLQVPKSVSSLSCGQDFLAGSVTPTFSLSPLTFASPSTNITNGKATGIRGLITAVDANGNGFSVTGDLGSAYSSPTFQVALNGSTTMQGVSGISQLTAGILVDMDVAIQSDGSLLATRVAVYDTTAANLTMANGPLAQVAAAPPSVVNMLTEYQGPLLAGLGAGPDVFSFGNAAFQISGQLSNIGNLPFAASFNAANMVPGQNVLITTHATSTSGGPTYTPASTITLLPQTIDGTVSAISNDGAFTTYTVTLAPYDAFADFAVQAGQTTLLSNPDTVVVYADDNTQMLTGTITVGTVFRFNGLVFNDNGSLRMDCAQISDGVAE